MTGIIPPNELTDETAVAAAANDAMEPNRTTSPIEAETAGDELAGVRELVLRAHADAVPELVTGATVAELLASVEPARAAYARIAERLAPAEPAAPSVPAGGAGPVPVDPDRLPAPEKIRRGLASR